MCGVKTLTDLERHNRATFIQITVREPRQRLRAMGVPVPDPFTEINAYLNDPSNGEERIRNRHTYWREIQRQGVEEFMDALRRTI